MRGPTPDPRSARRGTSHYRQPTDIAPVEFSGAITPEQAAHVSLPAVLPKTKAVKALWRVILEEVARHELRAADLPAVEALVVAKVRHTEAGMYVKKHGLMIYEPPVFDEDGNVVSEGVGPTKNPMLKVEREQALVYDRLAQRLGLSPEARIRLDLLQVSGASLLRTLRKNLDEAAAAEADEGDEVEYAELVEDAELVDDPELPEDGEPVQ